MTSSNITKIAGSFGRLWGRGHESFSPELRRILSIQGKGATPYLQNLVTCDLSSPPPIPRSEPAGAKQPGLPARMQKSDEEHPPVEFTDKLRSACFLDHKGRIVTDTLVWKMSNEHYFVDCPGSSANALLKHLNQYKLRRSKVTIEDNTNHMANHVVFGTLQTQGTPPGYMAGLDPRHPSLGLHILKLPTNKNDSGVVEGSAKDESGNGLKKDHAEFAIRMSSTFPSSPGNYELVRRLAGVAEGLELAGKIALESNQELLNAVSFHKGCYLGQELTARVNYTGVIRKRVMPLILIDPMTEVPQAWSLASSLQEGRAKNKFTVRELRQLPSKLPRLSVLTAGNLVAITTGSIEPDGEAIDDAAKQELAKVQQRAAQLLAQIEASCTAGAKIIDAKEGKKIGEIISPPVKGTNVVLALMKLETIGLLGQGIWSKTNKIKIGDSECELRYLPYQPLWWPEIDSETGKTKEPSSGEELPSEEEESVDSSSNEQKQAVVEFETTALVDKPRENATR